MVHARATAVVSWPAPMNVRIWSRSSRSVRPAPVSSSRTCRSIESRSPRVAPGIATPPGQDVRDHAVERAQGPASPEVPRGREARRRRQQVVEPVLEVLQDRRDGLGDPVGLADQVDAHQGAADDPQRQPREFGRDVERLIASGPGMLAPSPEHRLDRLGHHAGQGLDPLVMEGRLRHPPQAGARPSLRSSPGPRPRRPDAVVIPAPRVIPRVIEQHPPDMVWMARSGGIPAGRAGSGRRRRTASSRRAGTPANPGETAPSPRRVSAAGRLV